MTNVTFVARWAIGHRSAPVGINLRLLAINANSWETGQPFAPWSKETKDQRLLPRWLPKTEEGPSSWPQYNRFTSLEWSQEHKWMWQVVNHFLTQLGATYLSWLPSLDPSLHRPAPSWEPQESHSIGLLLYPSSVSGRDLDSPTVFYKRLTVLDDSWWGMYYKMECHSFSLPRGHHMDPIQGANSGKL